MARAMLATLCIALLCAAAAAQTQTSGYIVTGKVTGGNLPVDHWGFAITRQSTHFEKDQEVILDVLIAPKNGFTPAPTYTAYDPASRSYFAVAGNGANATVWGFEIAADVNSTKPICPASGVTFTVLAGDKIVGIESLNVNSSAVLLVVYASGTVQQMDCTTGSSKTVAQLGNSSRMVSQAITTDSATGTLYAVTESVDATAPKREVVTLTAANWNVQSAPISKLVNHVEDSETAFEAVWLPAKKLLLVLYTGGFDQLIYVDPVTGKSAYGAFDIAEFSGDNGFFYFLEDAHTEEDDLWTDAVFDGHNRVYFQCSEINPNDETKMRDICFVVVDDDGAKTRAFSGIGVAISPVADGYTGFQFVTVE